VYTIGTPDVYPPAALSGSGGASGSGCSPGAGPLPSGIWYGFVAAKGPSSLDFDLACFFFGSIAYTKGAEDGQAVEDDLYIRNNNPTLRTVPVGPSAVVYELTGATSTFVTLPYAAWTPDPTGSGYWLVVNGGVVTEIMEQYVP
jgi:hypothetical protein